MSSDLQNGEFQVVNELSKYMKTNSKANILSILSRLKADSKCQKQFSKGGGLELLIGLLRFQNLQVLNAALSLLANMCLSLEIKEEVRDTKIANYTLWITRNLKLGNDLHCRASRLIGNLSECSWHAKSFYDAGAVQILNDLLHTDTNTQTHLMTIRALRNIWNSYEKSRVEIVESGVIKRMTTLFVRATEMSYESKYVELAETCLKAMCAFVTSLDSGCGMQMRGETDEEGYKCIMTYCEAKNKLALKCLYSLSQIAECRPSLGISGAVERLLSLVTRNVLLPSEILASLCLFCREAVNRVRIKLASGLELMMVLLKNDKNEKFHPMLLHALSLFTYDDDGMVIMVKNGLLDVLIDKLKNMIEIVKLENKEEKEGSKKRSRDSSPRSKSYFKYNRSNSGRFSLDYHQDDWSRSSAASTSSSPPSTPPLPLYDTEGTEESAEENYSPVCSDDEWEDDNEEGKEQPQEEVESLKSFMSATLDGEDEEEQDETEKPWKSSTTEHMNVWTLALLSRLSDSNEPIEKLADPTTIDPLATYIRLARNPKALRILTRIVKNKAYLIPLIQQGFVFEAQTLYGSEQYTRLLCQLAGTGGAVGQLSAILLRGKEVNKNIIAVSIPFLIKSKEVLRNLLNNHGGLPLIFRILADREHSLHENAILSISRLADSIDIRPDTIVKNQLLTENSFNAIDRESFDNLPKPSMVTFELDDGTTIDACRRILCQKSDAFSAMLEGNFLEAGKSRVKLKNTSKEGLNTLLLAANGATFNNQTIEELLDAVLLADKFLMTDVSEILIESSMSRLNHDNFSRAWNWARNNSCPELKSFCLKSFLSTEMTRSERLRAFQDFSTGDCFMEFLEEIREIVNTVLCQR